MTCWLCGFETTELTTNPETPTCKNGPCHVCIEVATVDEEINQAVATLHRLLTKRRDLRSEQNRVHGCLIHRLPTELKNYVFELLLPLRDEWGERLRVPRAGQSVTLVTSVCRGWRNVAWSNPSLWSTIYITTGATNPTTDPSSQINFVGDWILRSRTLPLRVVLCNKGKSGKEFQSIINAIGHFSDRFHTLSFEGSWGFSAIRNFQCHRLKRLRLIARNHWQRANTQSLFDPNMSLEKIETSGVPFKFLQVSWNHLTSAKVEFFDLREISQLFQHASQMSCCHIFSFRRCTEPFSFPLVIHHRLKIFGMCEMTDFMPTSLFDFLTLPSLQEFHTDDIKFLTPAYLPALVRRSSCPLTRLTLKEFRIRFYSLQAVRGVTDIVLESLYKYEAALIKELLINGYFPDLRHLTLRLEPFIALWDMGIITSLLDRKRPRRLDQLLVVDHPSEFGTLWNTGTGKHLKALDISMREDGFEFILQG